MELMTFENQGIHLVKTNFFRSERARDGACFVSVVKGAVRLLLPPGGEDIEGKVVTATAATITRGVRPCPATRMPRPAIQLVLSGPGETGGFTLEAYDVDCFHWPRHYVKGALRCLVYTAGPKLLADVPARILNVENQGSQQYRTRSIQTDRGEVEVVERIPTREDPFPHMAMIFNGR